MKDLFDNFSQFIVKALKLLFVGNPLRTSLGVVVGMFFHSIINIFSPLINSWEDYVDVSSVGEIQCVFMGLVFVYSPTIISFIGNPKKELLDERLEKVFRLIEFAETKGNITKTEIRALFIKLCEKAVEQVTFNDAIEEEIKAFEEVDEETNPEVAE